MVRKVCLIALAGVLGGCPKSAPGPVEAQIPEGTRFSFDWPDGIEGVRSAEKITTRQLGERELSQVIHTTEGQRAERVDDGWLVHSTDGEFHPPKGTELDPAFVALARVPLAFEVDAEGRFDGLHDADGWSERARAAMLATATEGDVTARLKADTAVHPRKLEDVLADDWYASAEFWIGKSAVPGESGQVPGTAPTGQPTNEVTEWSIEGPVACGEGGPVACVLATATVRRDRVELEREADGLLQHWLRDQPEAPERAVVDSAAGEVEVSIVAEPTTLVVYRYTRLQNVDAAAMVDGTKVPLGASLSKTVTWAWTRPGADG